MHRNPHRDAAPRQQEHGQTMAEYAVALSVITVIILGAIIALGNQAGTMMQTVADFL